MFRRTLAFLVPLALLVACSPAGSGEQSQGGGGGGEETVSESAAESAAASTGGGGGGASDACSLITAEEAASVMGVATTTTEPTAGEPSYCNYRSDGDLVAATSFGTTNAEMVFGIYEGEDGATLVSGIGDKAVFSPSTATLFIVKGEKIVGITAGPGSMEIGERQDLAEQLGTIAAGRL